jgi:hypothetical protein
MSIMLFQLTLVLHYWLYYCLYYCMYSSKEPFGTVPQLDSLSSPPGNALQWRVTSNGSDNGSLPNSSPPPLRQQQPQQRQQHQQQQQQREMLPGVAAAVAAMRSSSSVTSGNAGLTGTIIGTSSTANNSVVSRARLAAGRPDEQCKHLNLYCGASRTANLLRRGSDLNLNSGANSSSKLNTKAALIGYKRGSSSTASAAAQNDSSDEQLQQQQQELHLNTAVPFSAVVLGAEGSGCAHTVQALMQAFVNTSSDMHTANSSSSSTAAAAAAAAVPDVSSIKGKASVLVLHYEGQGGGTGVSPYAKMATDSMAQQQVKLTVVSTLALVICVSMSMQ